MKRFLFLCFVLIAITSCGEQEESAYIGKYAEKLLTQYPNYRSNDIAQDAIKDSIENHAKSFIGKVPSDIDGLAFEFIELVEKDGERGALFRARCNADIESNSDKKKYIIATVQICVFAVVPNETAAKLDANKTYKLSGILADWDKRDYSYSACIADMDFGTYFLDNAEIKEAKQ